MVKAMWLCGASVLSVVTLLGCSNAPTQESPAPMPTSTPVPGGVPTPAPTSTPTSAPTRAPTPMPTSELQSQLQQTLDELVSIHRKNIPTLSMSFAWKDANTEVAVASGDVSGRSVTVDDTFLYGSGTKPLTAASVFSVIERGLVKAEDKVHTILDPYLERMGKPSTEQIWGPKFKEATVLNLLRMEAGIRDFEDDYSFDKKILADSGKFWKDYPYDAINFSVSTKNIEAGGGTGPLICRPNTGCSSYSSTSYDVAGLVLAALLQPDSTWSEFDLGSVLFPDRSKVPSMKFPNGGDKISASLTVPGVSISPDFSPEPITIFEQDSSILGFTCGNMAARPTDVARFYYWVFDPEGDKEFHVLSRDSVDEMLRTQYLTKGWAAGDLEYGAGIQYRYYGDAGIMNTGHGGVTYAFTSASGYIPELQGSFSLIANNDNGYLPSQKACIFLQVMKRHITGDSSADLGCDQMVSTEVTI